MHERCGVPAGQDLLQAVAGMNGADRHRAEEIIEAGFVGRFFCRAIPPYRLHARHITARVYDFLLRPSLALTSINFAEDMEAEGRRTLQLAAGVIELGKFLQWWSLPTAIVTRRLT